MEQVKGSNEIWSAEDELDAASEGWALVDNLEGSRKYDIIALAGLPPVFTSDAAASEYVRTTYTPLHNKVRRLNGYSEVNLSKVRNMSDAAPAPAPASVEAAEAEALYKALQNKSVLTQLKAGMQAAQDATYSSVYRLVAKKSFKQMTTDEASDLLLEDMESRMLLVSEACEGMRTSRSATMSKSILNDTVTSAISTLMVLASIHDVNLGEGLAASLQSACEMYADARAPATPPPTTKRIPTPSIRS